jgi:hypothetical protein
MRDSNPRGLAPDPLSNSAPAHSGWFADGFLGLRARIANVGGRPRTVATETKTETVGVTAVHVQSPGRSAIKRMWRAR